MYTGNAPEAHHLNARDVWDSFTSAIGNAFAADETSTTVVTKTVTTSSKAEATTTSNKKTTTTSSAAAKTTTSAAAKTTTVKATTTAKAEETTFAKGIPLETTTTTLPTAFVPADEEISSTETTLAIAPQTTKTTSSDASATRVLIDQSTTTSARASATAQPATDSGDGNTAAKAGIAIGVLAGILAVFVLAWFAYSHRKKKMEKKQMLEEDEKINGPINPFADSAAIRPTPSPTVAPRLSLRPVTQFLPNIAGLPDRRTSRGASQMLNAEPQTSQLQKPMGGSVWERPTVNSSMNSPGPYDQPYTNRSVSPQHNPFTDSSRIPEEPSQSRPISPPSPAQGSAALAATPNSGEPVSPIDGPSGNGIPDGAVAGAAAGAAAAGGLVRKASMRKDLPRPLDLTMPPPPMAAVPPSPAGTEFSMNSVAPGQPLGPSTSAAAIAAAGGPPQSTVHRVTLDFKPTMDDEMGLKAGQLVRLLHEYDDGWALCIRLDRSQQGVVPRTCLSTRPVKPRPPQGGGPRGPPVNPSRPGYPPHQGMNRGPPPPNGPYGPGPGPMQGGRPQSPAGGRPMSPYGGPGPRPASPGGRAMSPGPGQRSQSPGPRYQGPPQGRPQSPSGMSGRRMSPPGPSQMGQQPPRGPPPPGQAY